MPRVSDAHRERRRAQIRDAARACFAANGFHQTSMDDVIRASGLSAGAVYQYVRSKDDLVVEVAGDALAAIRRQLEALDPAEVDPLGAFTRVLHSWPFVPGPDGIDVTRLAVHGWSEATRNPTLNAVVAEGYQAFRTRMGALLTAWRDAGAVPSTLDVDAAAQALLSVVLGYVVQRAIFGPSVDPSDYTATLAGVLRV
jgi:AcrR family transcriptional regulator